MPEGRSRLVTDHLAAVLFAPSGEAVENLRGEGVSPEPIHFVGNVMIDSLVVALPGARALEAPRRHGVARGQYTVVTLHRPANVDDPATLCELIGAIAQLGTEGPVLFPVHPRTRARLRALGADAAGRGGAPRLEPLPCPEVLGVVPHPGPAVPPSRGLPEDTRPPGVPYLSLRPNTRSAVT